MQTTLLSPLSKVNENRYEVYEGRKFIGYMELERVGKFTTIEYKYTVGLCYGGSWSTTKVDAHKIMNVLADGMVNTYRKRQNRHAEAWE
ncbi:hypothetical protein [Jeotgalibaca sp. A127]|uniref:hypothetical protein n=1 Tax=Jeotgalibaca sp. A127 TaxID=3457324 RepID=UPI003FD6AFEC